jgi:hypothetical protein
VNYTYFVMLRASTAWLKLSRQTRRELSDQHFGSLINTYKDQLHVRHFDAEAFSAPCSDVMMVETRDPKAYYYFMESLRDSALITEPYFEVLQILPTVEDGYKQYEADATAAAPASP